MLHTDVPANTWIIKGQPFFFKKKKKSFSKIFLFPQPESLHRGDLYAFQYCCLCYLPKHLSEVTYQGTTAILCIKKLKMKPAVAYVTELSPILHAASDAYLTAFFFISAISFICLFCAVPCFSEAPSCCTKPS